MACFESCIKKIPYKRCNNNSTHAVPYCSMHHPYQSKNNFLFGYFQSLHFQYLLSVALLSPPDSVKSFTLFHLLPLSLSQCLCHFFHPWQTGCKEHLITLAEIILVFSCQFIKITVSLAATMTDMKVFTGLTVLIGGICFSSFHSYINLKML